MQIPIRAYRIKKSPFQSAVPILAMLTLSWALATGCGNPNAVLPFHERWAYCEP